MDTPYEYYDGKLGVKVSYLTSDVNPNPLSLKLIKYNALYLRCTRYKNKPEKLIRRSCLGYDALVLFSSLCREWKDALVLRFGSPQEEVKKSWFAQHYEPDPKARDFFEAYRIGEEGKRLDRSLVDRYIYNASVLNTVLKMKVNRKAYAKALGCTSVDIWESLSRDVNAFKEVEHNLPTTSRGLQNVVKRYQEEGYEGLVSKKLQNTNAAKVKEDDQLALLDELLAKHTNLDNVQVANIYNTVAGIQGWKTITPVTVGNRKEGNALVIYAGRNGKNTLIDTMLMQNKRKAPSLPMLYWTLDGWDAELLYQKTTVDSKGYSTTTYHNRLTVVVVLDAFNKYPIGYAIGTHETPALIKEAMRNAIQHTQQLFGNRYKPYQLQSDNYGKGALKPMYEACTTHYTPARVKNAKSKIIEPWFNRFNKDYCQMFNNWSGHNVDSGSLNQPNAEMLNKLNKTFPDEAGCRQQLITSLEAERAKKVNDFTAKWQEVADEYRSAMTLEMYLKYLGETTGHTNRLMPDGLRPKINGVERWYDSFDLSFRKQAHLDWVVKYDPADLSTVLVLNAERKAGKVQEIGTYQFLLTEKYIQPMALAERNDGDALALQQVKAYNNDVMQYITDKREANAVQLEELFSKPQLNDTLAKLVLVDSRGQHKNRANENRLNRKAAELIEAAEVEETTTKTQSWYDEQRAFNQTKVNLNDYL